MTNDPAALSAVEVALTYPGVHALWAHRVAHQLWKRDRRLAAKSLATFNRFVTGIEIHPGATIGQHVFIDHGMGVVIGETAVVGDGCLLYKGVVLGGVSLERGPRHPRLGPNVVVGSNACVLGNIEVGEGARIGSGSVVVRPVPAGATVVGVPGRVVPMTGSPKKIEESLNHASLPDPVSDMIRQLAAQNEQLRKRIEQLEANAGMAQERTPMDEEDPFEGGAVPRTHGG
jgi:serine O-acetyltransferase